MIASGCRGLFFLSSHFSQQYANIGYTCGLRNIRNTKSETYRLFEFGDTSLPTSSFVLVDCATTCTFNPDATTLRDIEESTWSTSLGPDAQALVVSLQKH